METMATVNLNFMKSRDQHGTVMYQFIFTPTRVSTLTSAPIGTTYVVTIQLTSNVPGAVLQFINRDPGSPLPGGLEVSGFGTTALTLTFTNTGGNHLDYGVTVLADGQYFRSPDPEIEVPPPNG